MRLPSPRLGSRATTRPAVAVAVVATTLVAAVLAAGSLGRLASASPAPPASRAPDALQPLASSAADVSSQPEAGTPPPRAPATDRPTATGTPPPPTRTPPPSHAPTRAPTPRPSSAPALPGMVGSIGDSISVAFDADPRRFGPQPGHSWVTGAAAGDGVDSHLERLRRLGADPRVVVASRAGARMTDGVRQARAILAAAERLPAGATAYVTIALGANDLCRDAPELITAPDSFAAEFAATLEALRDGAVIGGRRVPGLPRGSRLLVLSVPNALALRTLVQGSPPALAIYRQFGMCGAAVPAERTPAELEVVGRRLDQFDRALREACRAIEKRDGPSNRLHCRDDQAGDPEASLSGAPFTLADLSGLDYFHPSLRGQARIADGAWRAGYWAGS